MWQVWDAPAYLLNDSRKTLTKVYDFPLDRAPFSILRFNWMDSCRTDREAESGNADPENSAEGAKGDALLEQIQKIDLTGIEDERSRAIIGLLLNVVEDLRGELKKAQQEIAYLRERLRLRQSGEGKPGDKSDRRRKSGASPRNEPRGRS